MPWGSGKELVDYHVVGNKYSCRNDQAVQAEEEGRRIFFSVNEQTQMEKGP